MTAAPPPPSAHPSPHRRRTPSHRRRWVVLACVGLALLVLVTLVVVQLRPAADPVPGSATPTSGTPTEEPVPPPVGPAGEWTVFAHDEFRAGTLDTSLWQPSRYGGDGGSAPFNPDDEAAWFDPNAVSVSDGVLHLGLRRDPRTIDGREYPYSSGVVQTVPGRLLPAGTYLEARITVPRCPGCWPAFWAVDPQTWPPELDVMEFFGTGQQSQPSFNYISEPDVRSGPDLYGDPQVDYRDGWHTYGVLWDGSSVTPYLDGVAQPAAATSQGVRDTPLTVVLNLSVLAGNDPGNGYEMTVDWVRAWQPAGAGQ